MKLRNTFLITIIAAFGIMAFADNIIVLTLTNGNTVEENIDPDTDSITFNDAADSVFFPSGNRYAVADIEYIEFKDFNQTTDSIIYITWNGTDAPTIRSSAPDVSFTVEGQDVLAEYDGSGTEYIYVLDGESASGSFILVSNYKSTIRLNGLNLQSTLEEALNIKCGKRVNLELADGTTNTLADATTDNGQKGAIYCKGHLEVTGGGTLNITGNVKHGISTKEYLQIKKRTGTINILSAVNDGIHAGQYFKMNGGTLSIKGVGGDGIQAEITDDSTDEQNGQLIINGGTLDITTTADDAAALKSDSLLTITDGNITLSCSGNGSKGIKSKTTVDISGGELNITQSGGLYEDTTTDDDTSTDATKSYKVFVSIPGSNSQGGWGGGGSSAWSTVYLYKSDGTLVTTLSNSVSITSGYTTTKFFYYDFGAATSDTYYFKSDNYTSRGMGGTTYAIQSATFTGPTSGSDIYYSITSSYQTSGTTRTYSINNVTSTYSGGGTSTTEGDLSSAHSIKGDEGVSITGGTITIKQSGTAGKSVSTDKDINIAGGSLSITNDAEGQTEGTTNYTAKGLTADHNVTITSGTVIISMSGSGGKGIKADNNIYIGDESSGDGPTLSVVTTGSSLGSSSSGGGGGNPWGGWGQESSSGSSAKAMKCVGSYYQYGGNIYVSTASNGAEGIESKTSSATSMNFAGGNLFMKVYDDCINAAGQINFTGAHVICYSTGNDAIDSNYGRAGAVTITDGAVITFSQKGGAEMGLDCDGMSYVKITGGYVVAGGGSQGGSSTSLASGSTHYKVWSGSVSYTQGRYYSVVAGGKNIFTFLMPCTVSSSLNVYASSAFTSSTTHTVYYGTTAPTAGTSQSFRSSATATPTPMFWTTSNITSGTGTATTFSPN
ncbi:MAG: carbohydrate-binding domain-containing protein [Bacteroidaceae bacterium]|nr:carbohydrate-binding domain-containing protein [Bacteroidaceae bacterium]